MNKVSLLVKKYWIYCYWLLFSCLAAVTGKDPGYVLKYEPLPEYPIEDVFISWVIFAVFLIVLNELIYKRKLSNGPKYIRPILISVYVFFVIYLVSLGIYTDQSGIIYAISFFGISILVLLISHFIYSSTKWLLQKK